MKEYTKQITVQAVQWTGDLDGISDFIADAGRTDYNWYVRNMELCFYSESDNFLCPMNHYLVSADFLDLGLLFAVSPEDFQRDYKEVTP